MIELDDVSIRLGERMLVSIDATVPPGGVLALMGPSGSGKSSLIAYVAGFLEPAFEASGRVRIAGIDVTALPAAERGAGILFQDPLLFPHMSVAGNLAFAVPAALRGAARRDRVDAALHDAELDGFGPRDPATLSGGQAARVALMRVLLSEPRALLLDEPFSKLDTALRARSRDFTFRTARARGLPTILVTHDEEDARAAEERARTFQMVRL